MSFLVSCPYRLPEGDGIEVRRRFRETMGRNLGQTLGRIYGQTRGQRFHRKRDLDNNSRSGDDYPHRGVAQRVGQCFWSNYQQSEHHSIKGNAFLEIVLVLPLFWLLISGLVGTFQYIAESYGVGQAAEAGVVALASGLAVTVVQHDVVQVLAQEGYSTVGLTLTTTVGSPVDSVKVVLPFHFTGLMLPMSVGAIRTSPVIATGGGGNPGSWW